MTFLTTTLLGLPPQKLTHDTADRECEEAEAKKKLLPAPKRGGLRGGTKKKKERDQQKFQVLKTLEKIKNKKINKRRKERNGPFANPEERKKEGENCLITQAPCFAN